jgi:hypothetical protein
MTPVRMDFTHTPTAYAAIMSKAFVIGMRGPVGSGKSSAGCAFIMKGALEQPPDATGVRRTRWAVIRNTAPELKSTTIPTFTSWFPEGVHGRVVYASPIVYHIQVPKTDRNPGVDCEVWFIALDRPQDVRKLLSLELTGAWVNEAREVERVIVTRLTERVGRYPPRHAGPSIAPQILMDTNSMDEDHWWYQAFEVERQDKLVELSDGAQLSIEWAQFVQPPAVLEVAESSEGMCVSVEPGYTGLQFRKAECIHSAGKLWAVNPNAENLPNLRAGYYHQQIANRKLEEIQCYQQNKYVYVADGRPVIPEYVPSLMGGDWPILESIPLTIGIDAGGGTLAPAMVVAQRHRRGTWIAQGEFCGDDMGMERFRDAGMQYLGEQFPNFPISAVWTDPAAEKRDEIYETKVNDYFKAIGWPVRAAPTQDPETRIDAIRRPCGRLIDGKPGLLVAKHRAPRLHKGLSGSWYYRRLQVGGSERHEPKPIKNEFSHPADALGYLLCGGGEARVLREARVDSMGRPALQGTRTAVVTFDPYG